MGQQIEELAKFVAATRWEDVPEAVQRHAKITLLDTLGVILAGGERPEMRQLRERLSTTAGTGATVYARGWPVQDPRTAAMLNGIAGRSIELCEGLRLVYGQAHCRSCPGCWRSESRPAVPAATSSPPLCSAMRSPAGSPPASRRALWRIRTARCRCWPPPRPARNCAASTPAASAARCASRPCSC